MHYSTQQLLSYARQSREHSDRRHEIDQLGLSPDPTPAEWNGGAKAPNGKSVEISVATRKQMGRMILQGCWQA